MGSVVSPKVLGQVLASAGSSLSPAEFLSILSDAVDSTDTLTQPERAFLRNHGGVEPDVFDSQRLAEARQRIAGEAAKADSDANRGGYTTTEVAELLGVATANVRRSAPGASCMHLGCGTIASTCSRTGNSPGDGRSRTCVMCSRRYRPTFTPSTWRRS